MLSVQIGRTRVGVSVPFAAVLAAALTLDRGQTAALCVLASLLHEGGHLLVMCLVGAPPAEICGGVGGIRVTPAGDPLSYGRQAAVLAAGPAVNLLTAGGLALCSHSQTAVAAHLVLGLFNLLPIEALDGGQLLRCLLLTVWAENTVSRVMTAVSVLALLPPAVTGFWFLLSAQNGTLLLVCGYLLVRIFAENRL